MRLAYISLDEVHRDLAASIARERNDTVVAFAPGAEPDEGFDAVLHDLDYLSPAGRRQLLARLRASSASRPVPVGLHTYDPDDEVSALAARGVVVARRMGPDLFRSLAPSRLDAPASLRPANYGSYPGGS
jgi:hypothetical protein